MRDYKLLYDAIKNYRYDSYTKRKTKDRPAVEYLDIPCGFDIEATSTFTDDNQPVAFMYAWAIGVGHNNGVFYGRTWEQFVEVCEQLQFVFELTITRRLVVYVHNLGYEYQFMRRYFRWIEMLATDKYKPLVAVCNLGIEFRDSLKLSGMSLERTAKNLHKHKVKKLVGDLDYSLERHSQTPLTQKELNYLENDVRIVTAYIDEEMERYEHIGKVPYTNTGRVRRRVRHKCLYDKETNTGRFRKNIRKTKLNLNTYRLLKSIFSGGFTHSNSRYSLRTVKDVSSIDFTSSYPAVMVAEEFPMSPFKKKRIRKLSELDEMNSKYCTFFAVRIYGLKQKIKQESYISESKVMTVKNPVINNGRIYSADYIEMVLTNIDYEIMQQVYEWQGMNKNIYVYYATKGRLPKPIVESVLDIYQEKTELKDVAGKEPEYMISKNMLNSIYGMTVTDVIRDDWDYSNDWELLQSDDNETIQEYNKDHTRFLYYAWGVWVTAYARRNLWTGILAVGDDYVYSDTDSLKLINYEKHEKYVNYYNQMIIEKLELACDYFGLSRDLIRPKTKDGIVKPLGIWDFEGTYPRFKALRSKNYIYEQNGKLRLTVAGLSKQKGAAYLMKMANGDMQKAFDLFNDGLQIPAEETGKLTHHYIDSEIDYLSVDYLGNHLRLNVLTGLHLEPVEFTLSIPKAYKDFTTEQQIEKQLHMLKALRRNRILNDVKK